MKPFWPALLVSALLGGAALLLLRRGEDEAELDLAPPAPPEATTPAGSATLAPSVPPRPPEAAGTRPPRTSAEPVVIDPRTLPTGPLEVLVLGPDDVPIPHEDVRVRLEPGKGAKGWHSTPMLLPDPETNVWKGADVWAGPVRVLVSGDTIAAKEVETQVRPEGGEALRVHVDRAGAVEYAVTLWSGEEPTEVTLKLLDAQGKPALVGYQVRNQTVLTQPRQAREMTQAASGVIFGIPPGRYTLRVTSPAGEYEEAAVEVEALKTVPLALKVRR